MALARSRFCALFLVIGLPAASVAHEPEGSGKQWLAGDHHIHSRFSVGLDDKTDPPTPVMGADAAYPIPMNAIMARRFGLSWMVATGLRSGQVFVTTGDLISELWFTAETGRLKASTGEKLIYSQGSDIRVRIRVRDPKRSNATDADPSVARIDLIRGRVTGRAADHATDRNPTARIEARFGPDRWHRDGEYIVVDHVLRGVTGNEYIRVRGTSGAELEPAPDPDGEDPWSDLWFYANPIFLNQR